MTFSYQKFISFKKTQQHKKCSEILHAIYNKIITGDPYENLLDEYNQLQLWMQEDTIESNSHKKIADMYHYHLQKSGIGCKEHRLLANVSSQDRLSGDSPLSVSIYLDNIRSAHNIGSILRTTEAFALGSVYFSPQTPFIENQQVKKTSMGTSEWIECQYCTDLDQLPQPIIALETSSDAIHIHDFIFPEKFTLVVGNEEYGCSDYTLNRSDYILDIPLFGRKNSINVANAFAIAAAEITRQQRFHK